MPSRTSPAFLTIIGEIDRIITSDNITFTVVRFFLSLKRHRPKVAKAGLVDDCHERAMRQQG
jgi:hypothetical protein